MEDFLNWSAIQATMFVGHAPYIPAEWEYVIREDPRRWMNAISHEYGLAPNTNLMHQCYHLANWERFANRRVDSLRTIYEIGGGYGALCLICRRLGFEGEYIISDYPELRLIQEFYLESNGGIRPLDQRSVRCSG